MIEAAIAAAAPAVTSFVETSAIPVLGAWLASEMMGVSKKTKYNGIFHLAFGLLKAVGKELREKDTTQDQTQSQIPLVAKNISQVQSQEKIEDKKESAEATVVKESEDQTQTVLDKVAEAQSTLEQAINLAKTLNVAVKKPTSRRKYTKKTSPATKPTTATEAEEKPVKTRRTTRSRTR